jgi:hypothetical protein
VVKFDQDRILFSGCYNRIPLLELVQSVKPSLAPGTINQHVTRGQVTCALATLLGGHKSDLSVHGT